MDTKEAKKQMRQTLAAANVVILEAMRDGDEKLEASARSFRDHVDRKLTELLDA